MKITTKENAAGKISGYYVDGIKTRKNQIDGILDTAARNGEIIEVDYYTGQEFCTLLRSPYSDLKVVFTNSPGGLNLMTEAAAIVLGAKIGNRFTGRYSSLKVHRVEFPTVVHVEEPITAIVPAEFYAKHEIKIAPAVVEGAKPMTTADTIPQEYLDEVMEQIEAIQPVKSIFYTYDPENIWDRAHLASIAHEFAFYHPREGQPDAPADAIGVWFQEYLKREDEIRAHFARAKSTAKTADAASQTQSETPTPVDETATDNETPAFEVGKEYLLHACTTTGKPLTKKIKVLKRGKMYLTVTEYLENRKKFSSLYERYKIYRGSDGEFIQMHVVESLLIYDLYAKDIADTDANDALINAIDDYAVTADALNTAVDALISAASKTPNETPATVETVTPAINEPTLVADINPIISKEAPITVIEKKIAKNGAAIYYVNGKRVSCSDAEKTNHNAAQKVLRDFVLDVQDTLGIVNDGDYQSDFGLKVEAYVSGNDRYTLLYRDYGYITLHYTDINDAVKMATALKDAINVAGIELRNCYVNRCVDWKNNERVQYLYTKKSGEIVFTDEYKAVTDAASQSLSETPATPDAMDVAVAAEFDAKDAAYHARKSVNAKIATARDTFDTLAENSPLIVNSFADAWDIVQQFAFFAPFEFTVENNNHDIRDAVTRERRPIVTRSFNCPEIHNPFSFRELFTEDDGSFYGIEIQCGFGIGSTELKIFVQPAPVIEPAAEPIVDSADTANAAIDDCADGYDAKLAKLTNDQADAKLKRDAALKLLDMINGVC